MDATKLANELIDLHAHPRQVSPFSTRYPGLTVETGYAAARQLHAHRLAQGWELTGRKNGFTNRGIWQRYGVDGPMWGAVYDRTVVQATSNVAAVSLTGLSQPRIEPEICFKLKAAPKPTGDPETLLACIEWVAHSVEIVQCHHPEWKVTLADCVADNALHGRLIVGSPVRGIADLAVKLPKLKVKLFKENALVEEGLGSNVLDNPLLSLAFLVEVLARQKDAPPLAAGEIVSTGTLTDAHPVAAGETWRTAFSGIPLPGMEIHFT